jgi:DNA polymerase III epsilon subunit-like protein
MRQRTRFEDISHESTRPVEAGRLRSYPRPVARDAAIVNDEALFAVVDVETTGFSPLVGDRIVEIAILRLAADGRAGDELPPAHPGLAEWQRGRCLCRVIWLRASSTSRSKAHSQKKQTHASKTRLLTYLGLSVTPVATESEPRTEP